MMPFFNYDVTFVTILVKKSHDNIFLLVKSTLTLSFFITYTKVEEVSKFK